MNSIEAAIVLPTKDSIKVRGARRRLLAIAPALPLIVFLAAFFLLPLSAIFFYSIQDDTISNSLPRTTTIIKGWSKGSPIPTDAYEAVIRDFVELNSSGNIGALSQRVGNELVGGRAVVIQTVKKLSASGSGEQADWQLRLESAHPAWKQEAVWSVIANGSGTIGFFYLKWATDQLEKLDVSGKISSDQGYAFLEMFKRTALISLGVTLLTVLLGYPLSYVMVEAKGKWAAILLLMVLVPFWTSLLVRSMSWVVLLQSNGVVNMLLQYIGLSDSSIQLLYTRFATVAAMTQIQLPFTVLPMYSVMKTIPKTHVRAARSLGAGPLTAHITVFLPQALPGIAAGALLTFILCLGYYITPALVGGAGDQMASYYIARFVNEELNWGLASALSVLLTIAAVLIAMPLCRQIMRRNGGRI